MPSVNYITFINNHNYMVRHLIFDFLTPRFTCIDGQRYLQELSI